LFDIDAGVDVLVRQDPPNAGTLKTVGSLNVNVAKITGFDIRTTRNGSQVNDWALAVFQLNGSTTSQLYVIDLATGNAQATGISSNELIRGLALVIDPRATEGRRQ
jgi:Domain of unknown function (DUF4394)